MGTYVSADAPHAHFAAWLKATMRRADYDIDSQLGGGRAALADRLNVSRSTITRWLSGAMLPPSDQFTPLAEALKVPVTELLVEARIIPADALRKSAKPRRLTDEEIVAELGVTDPDDQAALLAMVERLRDRPPAPKRDHRQRGVGGHPRPHEVKADEQPDGE